MTRSEMSYFLTGASLILLIFSVAGIAEGTWLELGLKALAIIIVSASFIALILTGKKARR